jgi:hypothetical protein
MSVAMRFIFWSILAWLYGCNLGPVSEPEPIRLKLLPPAEGPVATLLKQKVTLDFREQKQTWLVVSRFEATSVRSVVLLASGQKLLSMAYNGDRLEIEGVAAEKIPGEEILAMMQFSLWPESSITEHYAASLGWQLEISTHQRLLKNDSGPVLKVSYMGSETNIRNYLQDYHVIVELLGKTEL